MDGSSETPTRRDAGSSTELPEGYLNLNELADLSPVRNPVDGPVQKATSSEDTRSHGEPRQPNSRTRRADSRSNSQDDYDMPDNYVNLDELATPSPVENSAENPVYVHRSLEEARTREMELRRDQEERQRASLARGEAPAKDEEPHKVSRLATQLYTISWLILFSFLGTLARLGLQAVTFYPGAPVVFSELWANFGGSLFMGFLSEDRMVFKEEWGIPTYHQNIEKARARARDMESGGSSDGVDLQAAKKEHTKTKKTIPLYIGLATGFCGCFTSFSSFIRDAFLALSNELPSPIDHPGVAGTTSSTVSRNGGYSFMALVAVIITTVALCISGLHIGAHLAIALEPYTPSLSFTFCRKILDRAAVFIAWGCWLGAIILAVFPPDRDSEGPEIWRGRAVFALVFAPLGCLGRFYASIHLNSRIASFPLGTFVVNILGTIILGMSYDLQHVPSGGILGCQVLQGIEDGFCGCLTTVSTWVSELNSLRRRNAYRYGAVSVVVALCFLIVIMGSMQWTVGFSELECVK